MDTIFIGDPIVTNKNFDGGAGLKGVVHTINDQDVKEPGYGIKFLDKKKVSEGLAKSKKEIAGEKLKLHKADSNTIKENLCYYLGRKQFEHTPAYEDKDKNKQKFVCNIRQLRVEDKEEIPNDIRKSRESIKSCQSEVEYLGVRRIEYLQSIYKIEKDIVQTQEEYKAEIDISDIINQYEKLLKNKNIHSVSMETRQSNKREYIIIKTKSLEYTAQDGTKFDTGAFIFYIPFDFKNLPIAANYKKHFLRGTYHHPCIKADGDICMGGSVKEQIRGYMNYKDLLGIVFTLIAFLKKPDYRKPYVDDEEFEHAQKATIKPKDVFNYLNRTYWTDHEKWDSDKYKKAMDKARNPNRHNPQAPDQEQVMRIINETPLDGAVDTGGNVPIEDIPESVGNNGEELIA